MSRTIQTRPADRHLTIADATADARLAVSELTATVAKLVTDKPTLRPLARLDVEQARKFLLELDTAAASTSPLLAMFLLGRCAEHAQALLDVIDAAVAL
jgi:hypothetical protein